MLPGGWVVDLWEIGRVRKRRLKWGAPPNLPCPYKAAIAGLSLIHRTFSLKQHIPSLCFSLVNGSRKEF